MACLDAVTGLPAVVDLAGVGSGHGGTDGLGGTVPWLHTWSDFIGVKATVAGDWAVGRMRTWKTFFGEGGSRAPGVVAGAAAGNEAGETWCIFAGHMGLGVGSVGEAGLLSSWKGRGIGGTGGLSGTTSLLFATTGRRRGMSSRAGKEPTVGAGSPGILTSVRPS